MLVRNGPGTLTLHTHTPGSLEGEPGMRGAKTAVLCGADGQDRKAEKWRLGNSHRPSCSALGGGRSHRGL